VRRHLSALLLVAAVFTAAISALASPAQAAGPSGPGSFGIQLVDVPAAVAGNPRALQYIIDHMHPGATIRQRIRIANFSPHAGRITIYPDAATITDGAFIGDAGETRSELTTWITTSRQTVSLAPHASATITMTLHVPRAASSGNRYGLIWAQETSLSRFSSGIAIREINRVGVRIYLSVGPGGAPPSNFAITSLIASRSAQGLPVVRARVRNTGGLALDISGNLKLSDGPGGLTAGPYNVESDVTLAPGQSWPVTILLSKQLPDGPWRAVINLVSGLTKRHAVATIQFPGSSRFAVSSYIIGAAGLLALFLVLIAALLIRRNRRSPATRGRRRGGVRLLNG
jgi:hypothetical protein